MIYVVLGQDYDSSAEVLGAYSTRKLAELRKEQEEEKGSYSDISVFETELVQKMD